MRMRSPSAAHAARRILRSATHPVARGHTPAATGTHPMVRLPVIAPTWGLPVTAHPDVAAATPIPVSANPDVPRRGSHSIGLYDRRRRRGSDYRPGVVPAGRINYTGTQSGREGRHERGGAHH